MVASRTGVRQRRRCLRKEEAEQSMKLGETADQSFNRRGGCVALSGLYILRTLWAVKGLRDLMIKSLWSPLRKQLNEGENPMWGGGVRQ